MKSELNKTKEKVSYLLEAYPETRDSDKLLILGYFCIFHNLMNLIGPEAYERLKAVILSDDVPSFESIRRVRQKLNQEGQYIGKSYKPRQDAAGEVREWALGDCYEVV